MVLCSASVISTGQTEALNRTAQCRWRYSTSLNWRPIQSEPSNCRRLDDLLLKAAILSRCLVNDSFYYVPVVRNCAVWDMVISANPNTVHLPSKIFLLQSEVLDDITCMKVNRCTIALIDLVPEAPIANYLCHATAILLCKPCSLWHWADELLSSKAEPPCVWAHSFPAVGWRVDSNFMWGLVGPAHQRNCHFTAVLLGMYHGVSDWEDDLLGSSSSIEPLH